MRIVSRLARRGCYVHRLFDRLNIGLRCAFEPRGVHAQHHLDAMSVLLCDPQQILSQHELPGHRGMPRVGGPAPSNIECLDALAPAPAGDFRVADRPSVFKKEQMLMVDFAGRDVLLAKRQVALKDFERARAKLNVAIVLRLGAVFISPEIANPVSFAHDGIEALEMLRGTNGRPRLPRPYLILLDLNMPRMDGIEFLKELRKDEELKKSIVFIMTTSDADDLLAGGRISGCVIRVHIWPLGSCNFG
jgi:CheY-like chemotaxis protein